MPESNPFRCSGSFKRGTACANCIRCEEKGYDAAAKAAAEAAEAERQAELPANRTKID